MRYSKDRPRFEDTNYGLIAETMSLRRVVSKKHRFPKSNMPYMPIFIVAEPVANFENFATLKPKSAEILP